MLLSKTEFNSRPKKNATTTEYDLQQYFVCDTATSPSAASIQYDRIALSSKLISSFPLGPAPISEIRHTLAGHSSHYSHDSFFFCLKEHREGNLPGSDGAPSKSHS